MIAQKKILYIDMDGVICCFDTGVKKLEPEMAWDRESVDRVCEANPRVFLELPDIEHSTEAILELKDIFDIYFLSTPMWNVPESWMDKRIYLEKRFGSWVEKRLILTHRKDLNIGHYLVDDRKVNGVENFMGEHIHFRSEMFPDWKQIVNYLKDQL